MKTTLKNRHDEYYFLMGYISRNNQYNLIEAFKWYKENQYNTTIVFNFCPFNDSFEQSLRSFHVATENKKHLTNVLINLFQEYLFLASDLNSPCCYDGRLFYCKVSNIVHLVCDRCDQTYDLQGDKQKKIQAQYKYMQKNDFITLFPFAKEDDWPYHKKIYKMLRNKDMNN